MSCGSGEFLVIGFVLLVVFSASRMGSLGNALGKFVYSFKKASRGHDLIDVEAKVRRMSAPTSDDKKNGQT